MSLDTYTNLYMGNAIINVAATYLRATVHNITYQN